jgi:hypothetical protein
VNRVLPQPTQLAVAVYLTLRCVLGVDVAPRWHPRTVLSKEKGLLLPPSFGARLCA